MQPILNPIYSLVVPVYGNEEGIADLVAAVEGISRKLDRRLEAVFVVDGSPDRSLALLQDSLPFATYPSQLVVLSRNFGSFAAIRVGLEHAQGRYLAVMAADLQEPPELVIELLERLRNDEHDIAFGVRLFRRDSLLTRATSGLFWAGYRKLVMPDIPQGGVDIFSVSASFRDRLLRLNESNSSLLAQLFWLGGRRVMVGYERRRREKGRSAWTLRKKLIYLSDSVFAFSDLPVRLLMMFGIVALVAAVTLGLTTLIARLTGFVEVPGYAGTILTIIFFSALNSLGLGVVGTYAWRAFENTKQRPLALVQDKHFFEGSGT